jgi:hypothetical protein
VGDERSQYQEFIRTIILFKLTMEENYLKLLQYKQKLEKLVNTFH